MEYGPPPPADPDMRDRIDRIAIFVAGKGPLAEERLRADHSGKPPFAFLFNDPSTTPYYHYARQCEIYNVQNGLPAYSRPPSHQDHPPMRPQPDYNHAPQQQQYPPRGYDERASGGYDRYDDRGDDRGDYGMQQQHQNHHHHQHQQQPHHHQEPHHQHPPAHGPPHSGQYPPEGRPPPGPLPTPAPASSGFNFEAVQSKIDQLRQEMETSEANLQAHKDALPIQKESEFSTAVMEAEEVKIQGVLARANFDVSGMDAYLEQLMGKCSKDVVVNMKRWVLDNCTTDQLREVILTYLLSRVRSAEVSEQFRLHVLYLINDWAHTAQRKKQDGVKQMLSRYVPQLYAFACETITDPSTTQKLDKLVGIWEGSRCFDDNCFKQLRNPSVIIHNYRAHLKVEYARLGIEIDERLNRTYEGYVKQNQEYSAHIQNTITALEAQIEMERARADAAHRKALPSLMPAAGARRSRFDCGPQPGDYGAFFNPAAAAPPGQADASTWRKEENWRGSEPKAESEEDTDIDGEPLVPGARDAGAEIDDAALIPKVPYHELPAGVMFGQIKIEDLTFKPIEVAKLRLPAPYPPTTRLLQAIGEFYAPPSPDRPRDQFGWEKDSLTEFFERKLRLRKILEDTQCAGGDRVFEDLIKNRPSAEDIEEERIDREQAREREAAATRSRSRRSMESPNRSRSRSPRSRTRSPPKGRSSSGSRSRSRSRSRSSSPRRRSRSRSDSPRGRKRSHSRSASPEDRPSFGGAPAFTKPHSPSPSRFAAPTFTGPPAPLSTENKGAQLMAKMGWSGKGLGREESGIQEPISGGEVRLRDEMYKGLGHASEEDVDEFEKFRRMRSGFYHEKGGKMMGRRLD